MGEKYRKRVIYRPSKYVMVITNPNVPELKPRRPRSPLLYSRTRSAPPVPFIVNIVKEEVKGLDLVNNDGLVLTKEMIDEMFMDSSEDKESEIVEETNLSDVVVEENKMDVVTETKEDVKIEEIEIVREDVKKEIEIVGEDVKKEVVVDSVKEEISDSAKKDISTMFDEMKIESDFIDDEPETYVYVAPKKKISKKNKVIKYTISEILTRPDGFDTFLPTIEIKFDKTILRRVKKEDHVSMLRLSLNKITWSNAKDIIYSIKNIKIRKEEVHSLSKIIEDKACTEQVFQTLYGYVMNELRDWFYFGELAEKEKIWNDRLSTCSIKGVKDSNKTDDSIYVNGKDAMFPILKEDPALTRSEVFNHVLSLLQKTTMKVPVWINDTSNIDKSTLSSMSFVDRSRLDEIRAEEGCVLNKIKDKLTGTVKFISILYVNRIISYKIIKGMIQTYMFSRYEANNPNIIINSNTTPSNNPNSESTASKKNVIREEAAELLCHILTYCCVELFTESKSTFNKSKEFLKSIQESYDERMSFIIRKVLEKMALTESGGIRKANDLFDKRVCAKIDETYRPKEIENKRNYDDFGKNGFSFGRNKKDDGFEIIGKPRDKKNLPNKFDNDKNRAFKQPNYNNRKNDYFNNNRGKDNSKNEYGKISNTIVNKNTFEGINQLNDNGIIKESDRNYVKILIDEISQMEPDDIEISIQEIAKDMAERKIGKSGFVNAFMDLAVTEIKTYNVLISFLNNAIKKLKIDNGVVKKAFEILDKKMDDVCIDCPRAKGIFEEMKKKITEK